jgi:hypothetical protein
MTNSQIAFAAVLCLFPFTAKLSAQTASELIVDACHNELNQRGHIALWSSRVERRTAGHVYLEKEIETVDGPVHKLLAVDGHEPSPSEQQQDDDKLRDLMQDPKARLVLKKKRDEDDKKFGDLLQAMPTAFLFDDQGKQGENEKLAFRPNPEYIPTTYEEMTLHELSGVVLIDLREKRLSQISGTLDRQVDFGYGLIGHLNKGGTIELNRILVSPGIWKTSSSRIDLNGRFVLFKTIDKKLDETHTAFTPMPSKTTIQQAIVQLSAKEKASLLNIR